MTSGTKRTAPAPPKGIHLQNSFTTLKAEGKPDVPTSQASGPPNPKPCKATRKKWWVIVMGDSLLHGTEASICQPDLSTTEVCCLPEAQIRDTVDGPPQLVQPSDYYPLLLLHMGINDTAKGKIKTVPKVTAKLCGQRSMSGEPRWCCLQYRQRGKRVRGGRHP